MPAQCGETASLVKKCRNALSEDAPAGARLEDKHRQEAIYLYQIREIMEY